MNADDSARMRDLLASNRTLLAWIRTTVAFAGLGFVVAKFGSSPNMIRAAGYRSTLAKEKPPPGAPVPSRWPAITAAVSCALVCLLLAVCLAVSTA